MVTFDWDDAKNRSNLRKHGVGFDTASLVFDDPYALMLQDRFENGEERWQAIGRIADAVVLVVAHTVKARAGTEVIRIMSARKADRRERKRYEDQTYGKTET